MDGAEAGIATEHGLDVAGDRAQLIAVGADHPDLHRPAGRRPEEQPVDLVADRREVLGEDAAHFHDEPLARGDVARHHEQLGEIRVAQLLVEGEHEARRALADIGRDQPLVRVGQHARLEGFRLGLDVPDAGPLGQPEIDEDFRPRRLREEILRDRAEGGDGGDEGGERQGEHGGAPVDAPGDRRAQGPIEGRVIDVAVAVALAVRSRRRAWPSQGVK